jgi:transposase
VAAVVALDNQQWALVEDLFDPPGRRGAPATYSRREMVDAILFLAHRASSIRSSPLLRLLAYLFVRLRAEPT